MADIISKNKLIERAIEIFGITQDPFEAGYILENGFMLDFSGKKIGGSPGSRDCDHRDIWPVFGEENGMSGTAAMDAFIIRTNSIRMGLYNRKSPSMNISLEVQQDVTPLQRKRLMNIVKYYQLEDICYDIYGVSGDMLARDCIPSDLGSAIRKILNIYLSFKNTPKVRE